MNASKKKFLLLLSTEMNRLSGMEDDDTKSIFWNEYVHKLKALSCDDFEYVWEENLLNDSAKKYLSKEYNIYLKKKEKEMIEEIEKEEQEKSRNEKLLESLRSKCAWNHFKTYVIDNLENEKEMVKLRQSMKDYYVQYLEIECWFQAVGWGALFGAFAPPLALLIGFPLLEFVPGTISFAPFFYSPWIGGAGFFFLGICATTADNFYKKDAWKCLLDKMRKKVLEDKSFQNKVTEEILENFDNEDDLFEADTHKRGGLVYWAEKKSFPRVFSLMMKHCT